MRYVTWFGSWIGHLIPAADTATRGSVRRGTRVPRAAAQLSSEDLFYIAMLGPHV